MGGHVASSEQMRNRDKILVGKSGRSMHRKAEKKVNQSHNTPMQAQWGRGSIGPIHSRPRH
jgi:hypothetical protein